MKLKIALLSATALGTLLMIGAAQAGSNNVTALTVTGNNNTDNIVQAGNGNYAGQSQYGLNGSLTLHQDGDSNSLSINQTGNGNSVDYTNYVTIAHDRAAEQEGSNNTATITQSAGNGGNALGAFIQEGNYNNLVFTQNGVANGYVDNSVGAIYQGGIGPDPRVHGIHSGVGGNSLTVTQTETGVGAIIGHGNSIQTITQSGPSDQATITQYGQNNALVQLSQTGGSTNVATVQQQGLGNRLNTLGQTGSNNQATVKLLGDYNGANSAGGKDDWTTVGLARGPYGYAYGANSFIGAAASIALVSPDNVVQTGSYNVLSFTASGNSNAYGFLQNGNGNTTTGSSYNDSNQVAVGMQGGYNTVNFYQAGGSNNIGVSIYGDNNNSGAAFNGNAGTAGAWGLSGGDIFQENGSGNSAQLNVGSDLATSSNNLFAMLQYGSNNTATGTISGNYNQAVVAQIGSSNSAVFAQTGSGNNAYVQQ